MRNGPKILETYHGGWKKKDWSDIYYEEVEIISRADVEGVNGNNVNRND